MGEISWSEIAEAKRRRDMARDRIQVAKEELKTLREQLGAAEDDYDQLVQDACNGQGRLFGDPEANGNGNGEPEAASGPAKRSRRRG